jgi:hypothetical protein
MAPIGSTAPKAPVASVWSDHDIADMGMSKMHEMLKADPELSKLDQATQNRILDWFQSSPFSPKNPVERGGADFKPELSADSFVGLTQSDALQWANRYGIGVRMGEAGSMEVNMNRINVDFEDGRVSSARFG